MSAQEGKDLSQQWNCAWIEASAKHNENISMLLTFGSGFFNLINILIITILLGRIFELMIGEIEKSLNPNGEESTTCCVC